MKIRLMLFLVILISFIQLNALVILEQVNIESEFCGPFSKNTAEFIFYNDSNDFEQEAICNFDLNSSAFISNLWLEIDGELHLDETFRVDTGTAIYNKITEKRKDPALLIKQGEKSYKLSIYPFSRHERRRVVIEYYSTLETVDNQLTWLFKTENYLSQKSRDSSIIYLNAIFSVPLNTMISNNNSDYWLVNDQPLITSNLDETILKIKFPDNFTGDSKTTMQIYDNINEIIEKPVKNKRIKDVYLTPNIPEFIENFIKDYNHTTYNIYDAIDKNDVYLNEFLKYIENEHLSNAPYTQILSNWFSKKDSIFYKDENLNLIKNSHSLSDDDDFYSIQCSFLKVFFEYLSILNQNYQEQVKSRFLTKHTAKLVLEKNKQTDKIRKDILRHEHEYVPIGGSTSKFVVYEDVPFPIKRPIPEIPDQLLRLFNIEGEVILQVEVLKNGKVGQIEVLTSLISFVDFLAIQDVKQWEFAPARSGGKNVACWVTFPIGFDYREYDLEYTTQSDSSYTVFDRELMIKDETLYERNFDFYNSKTIELYSRDFFNLIMKNLELIQITYLFSIQNKFPKIGLLNNSKESILIKN